MEARLFHQEREGNIVLMAENIKGARPATVGFQAPLPQGPRASSGSNVARMYPSPCWCPRVQLKKRLNVERIVAGRIRASPHGSRSSCGWWTEMANRISILVALEGADEGLKRHQFEGRAQPRRLAQRQDRRR